MSTSVDFKVEVNSENERIACGAASVQSNGNINFEAQHWSEPASIARFETAVTAVEMFADLLAAVIAVAFSYAIYQNLGLGKHAHYDELSHFAAVFAFAGFFVLMLDRSGAYRHGNSLLRVKETERILRVSAQSVLFVFPVTFFARFHFSRWLLAIGFVFLPLFVCAEKHALHIIVRLLHSKGYGVRKVVIYGSGETGRRVFSALVRSPKLGLNPVSFVDDDPAKVGTTVFELSYQRRRSARVLEGPLTKGLLDRSGASHVVIAIPSLPRDTFLKAVSEILNANATVSFVPNHFLPSDAPIDYADIDGLLLSSIGRSVARPGYEILKRVLDVVLSIALLVAVAPLFLVIAILIRHGSRGPVFFVQKRVGRNGRIFDLYKFRTMYVDAAAYHYSPKESDDPRITPVGKFLRRTSLDELPQLFNVIKGEMSLVGPRPEMPFIVENYDARQRQRLHVKPGLTGLWQLSADRAYLIHENLAYDMYYIKNQNLFMDVAILVHTLFFAMRGI